MRPWWTSYTRNGTCQSKPHFWDSTAKEEGSNSDNQRAKAGVATPWMPTRTSLKNHDTMFPSIILHGTGHRRERGTLLMLEELTRLPVVGGGRSSAMSKSGGSERSGIAVAR